jgi:hypothetical protein
MYLPLGQFSPDVRLGFVSASRNCFPRELAVERSEKLIAASQSSGIELTSPKGECSVIETRAHAAEAAEQLLAAGCDAVLHCNGDLAEMRALLDATGPMSDRGQSRADVALAARRPAASVDIAALRSDLGALLPAAVP